MNEKNLIPFSEREPREIRKLASKGGKKSAKIKKERRLFSETIRELLSMDTKNRQNLKKLENYGTDMSNQMLLAVSLFETATGNKTQSVAAFNSIVSVLNEKIEKLEVISTDKTVQEIQKYLESKKRRLQK